MADTIIGSNIINRISSISIRNIGIDSISNVIIGIRINVITISSSNTSSNTGNNISNISSNLNINIIRSSIISNRIQKNRALEKREEERRDTIFGRRKTDKIEKIQSSGALK